MALSNNLAVKRSVNPASAFYLFSANGKYIPDNPKKGVETLPSMKSGAVQLLIASCGWAGACPDR